jgi:hypothetical protein
MPQLRLRCGSTESRRSHRCAAAGPSSRVHGYRPLTRQAGLGRLPGRAWARATFERRDSEVCKSGPQAFHRRRRRYRHRRKEQLVTDTTTGLSHESHQATARPSAPAPEGPIFHGANGSRAQARPGSRRRTVDVTAARQGCHEKSMVKGDGSKTGQRGKRQRQSHRRCPARASALTTIERDAVATFQLLGPQASK